MPTGHKRVKGVPELHDEVKKRVNMTLTPTATKGLDTLAKDRELSRSELIEQIGRGQFLLIDLQEQDVELDVQVQYTLPPIQSLPIEQSHQLPSCAGAYSVVDFVGRIFAGYAFDLKHEFQKESLAKNLEIFFQKPITSTREIDKRDLYLYNNLSVFWIECSETILLPKLQNLIIETFYKIKTEEKIKTWLEDKIRQ